MALKNNTITGFNLYNIIRNIRDYIDWKITKHEELSTNQIDNIWDNVFNKAITLIYRNGTIVDTSKPIIIRVSTGSAVYFEDEFTTNVTVTFTNSTDETVAKITQSGKTLDFLNEGETSVTLKSDGFTDLTLTFKVINM